MLGYNDLLSRPSMWFKIMNLQIFVISAPSKAIYLIGSPRVNGALLGDC